MKVQGQVGWGQVEVGSSQEGRSRTEVSEAVGQDEGSSTESQSHMKVCCHGNLPLSLSLTPLVPFSLIYRSFHPFPSMMDLS